MVVASDTDLVTVLSSAHGRQRRSERLISKSDLQAAVKYGEKEASSRTATVAILRWKYTFRGIVYITDETSRREITSWPIPAFGFDVPLVEITENMRRDHRAAVRALGNKASWTSHTVAVVDQSGSMRNTDVDGGATRSDAVWLTLALTWVEAEIKAGSRKSTDVMSVVSMRNNSEVVVDAEPVDWILFNKLVGLLRESEPNQGGNYLAAIDLAEQCLMRNTMGSCATALLFFSDGRPSEQHASRSAVPKVIPKVEAGRGGVHNEGQFRCAGYDVGVSHRRAGESLRSEAHCGQHRVRGPLRGVLHAAGDDGGLRRLRLPGHFPQAQSHCGVSSEHLVKLIVDPHDDEDGAHRIGWLKTAHCS